MSVETRGYVTFHCKPNTVGDLREFLDILDKYHLADTTPVEDGVISVTLEGDTSPIQCGCPIPGSTIDWYVDALVQLHDCEED